MPYLCLFGLPSLEYQETLPLNTPSSLLFYLAVKGDWIARSELAFLYKPDETETEALKYLRLQLHRAQQYPWATGLEIGKHQLRWLVETDLGVFRRAIKEQSWLLAINTYKDSFFGKQGFKDMPTYSAWIDLERESLEQSYRLALNKQIGIYEHRSEYEQATDLSDKLLVLDEFDEDVMQQHLRHLALSGQKERALTCFDNFNKRLTEEVGSEPLEETLALIEKIRNDEVIALKAANEVKHNLPNQSTRFIGRKIELQTLKDQLAKPECRLLSLIGLGGSGKTRLGIELARSQVVNFKDGVYLMELAALDSEDALLSNLAQTMGLQLGPQESPKSQILSYLRNKHILLIFDNFEHLLSLTALLNDFLASSEQLNVVVTSRESLKLKGEWLFDVGGLQYPGHEDLSVENTLENNEAVSLFLSAARRVQPQLEPSPEDLLSIAQIAKQVEGLPLALELAASWVRIMPITRIAKELEQGYDLLEAELADVPERQRNIKAILDKTWDALSEKKRQTLAKFSVFVGGCTLEAAEKVTQSHFTILLSLINEALLRRSAQGRLDLHMLIKTFVAGKLSTAEMYNTTKEHALYYAEQANEHHKRTSLGRLKEDQGNLEKMWFSLLEQNSNIANDIPQALFHFYNLLGFYQQGAAIFKSSFNFMPEPSDAQTAALYGEIQLSRASLERDSGKLENSQALCQDALVVTEQYQLSGLSARAFQYLGDAQQMLGQYPDAEKSYEKASQLFEYNDNRSELANTLNQLASLETMQEKFDQAIPRFKQCVNLFEILQDPMNKAIALNNLGYIAEIQYRYQEAADYYKDSLMMFESIQFMKGIAAIKNNLNVFYGMLGDLDKAEQYGLESLVLKEKMNDEMGLVITLKNLGDIKLKKKQPAEALKYYLPAIKSAISIRAIPRLIQVLPGYAEYLQMVGQQAEAREILAALLAHPVTPPSIKDKARTLEPDLQIPPDPDENLLQAVIAQFGKVF